MAILLLGVPLCADIVYQIDDGSSESTIGIDPGEDLIWINTFTLQPGGEFITSISATFGRPGLGQALNGLSIRAILYQDLNGESPEDGILLQQVSGSVVNANTDTLNEFTLSPTLLNGNFAIAILFRNTTNETKFIASIDRTVPSLANRSFVGFAAGIDEFNLGSIPSGQFGTLESFGIVGNFVLRGNATAIPEPSSTGVVMLVGVATVFYRKRKSHTVGGICV